MKSECRHKALDKQHRAANTDRKDDIPKTVVQWACRMSPLSSLSPHYFLIGTPGSGKTNLLKILMNSVLPDKEYGLRFRAFVYDPKTEFYPFLVRMGIDPDRIIMTNPFDARSTAWNLARDFRPGGGHAEALASAIVQKQSMTQNASGGFFENAVNQTLTDVIEGLMSIQPDSWELRDVIEACATMEDLGAVLKLTATGKNTFENYFQQNRSDDRLGRDVKATLWSRIRPYIPIAAF